MLFLLERTIITPTLRPQHRFYDVGSYKKRESDDGKPEKNFYNACWSRGQCENTSGSDGKFAFSLHFMVTACLLKQSF